MATMKSEPRQVVAVFRTPDAARTAAGAARQAGATDVRVNSDQGDVLSLQSEMRDEMEHTFIGPGNVGPFTKEMSKGMSAGTIVGAIVGAVAALPFAVVDFGLPVWQRVVIALAVGAFAGSTVGFVLGGGLGARGPAEPLAAEEGTTVVATVAAARLDDVERALANSPGLIRVDLAVRDQPLDNIAEEDDTTLRDISAKTVQGEGDWSHVRADDADSRSGGRPAHQ